MYTEHQVPENVADKVCFPSPAWRISFPAQHLILLLSVKTQIQDVDHEAPDSVSPRPGRSEPLQSDFYAVAAFSEYLDDSEGGAAQVAVTAAPAYVAADYYTELRRRSLEGRPDVESLASEVNTLQFLYFMMLLAAEPPAIHLY